MVLALCLSTWTHQRGSAVGRMRGEADREDDWEVGVHLEPGDQIALNSCHLQRRNQKM